MNTPVLDGRSLEQLRQKVQELARSYTPEWRFEGSEDDSWGAVRGACGKDGRLSGRADEPGAGQTVHRIFELDRL